MQRSAVSLVLVIVTAAVLAAPAGVLAQEKPSTLDRIGQEAGKVGDAAGKLVTKPAEDVGVSKKDIPPLLIEATKDPYSLAGVSTCQQLSAAVTDLNGVLGPDFTGEARKEDKTTALANAGGNAALGALIPFRGVVREVSGAAPAQRAYNAAVDAGIARRGYLRGVHHARSCKTGF